MSRDVPDLAADDRLVDRPWWMGRCDGLSTYGPAEPTQCLRTGRWMVKPTDPAATWHGRPHYCTQHARQWRRYA